MKKILCVAALVVAAPVAAQSQPQPVPAPTSAAAIPVPATGRTVPVNTMLVVTPLTEVSSKHVKVGDKVTFSVTSDIVENGVVAIQRGTPVQGTIKWKTGKAIGGKSGKFEVAFDTVTIGGRNYALRGVHRQEGKGNTVAAVFASILISGRSAVMIPGQLVNAFTAEPISF